MSSKKKLLSDSSNNVNLVKDLNSLRKLDFNNTTFKGKVLWGSTKILSSLLLTKKTKFKPLSNKLIGSKSSNGQAPISTNSSLHCFKTSESLNTNYDLQDLEENSSGLYCNIKGNILYDE